MQSNFTTNRCFGGPGRTNCQNKRADGLFCTECRVAMRTPRMRQEAPAQPIYTTCVCGQPVAPGAPLCAAHMGTELPKLFKQPRRWRTKLIAALAVVFLAFTLLACTSVGDGSCKAPAPCGQVEGHNP